jgi:AcrR family transcriptional regulator
MSQEPGGSRARGRGRPPAGVREAILAAARDLIGTGGLAKLTTREVARRAGVSEASVFYHFQDKASLLEHVVLDGLTPLKAPIPGLAEGGGDVALDALLMHTGTALEAFFDNIMPVVTAVQSDADLRHAFAERLVKGDLGPHRGVLMLSQYLEAMAAAGEASAGVDTRAASLMLIGSCFLRSWERQMAGPERGQTLPGLASVVATLVQLLAPPGQEAGDRPD